MKKNTLFMLFFFIITINSFAQVKIGTGTNVKQNTPYKPGYGYSYTQSIYLSSEINAAGNITSIQWYYNGLGPLLNSYLVIYLSNTTKTSFSSSSDWVSLNNLTKVYEGDIPSTFTDKPGWVTIPLSIPFNYNGTDNLAVAVDENKALWDDGSAAFYNSETTENRSIFYYSDTTNPNPAAPPLGYQYNNNIVKFIPNIIFGGIAQTCLFPKNVSSLDVTTTSATILWNNPDTTPANGSDIYISTSNISPISSTTPTGTVAQGNNFQTNNLIPGTIYYAWVRNNCGNNDFSSWSEMTIFKTECMPIAAFSEDFDTTVIPFLPTCWDKIIRGATVSNTAEINTTDIPYGFVYSEPNSLHLDSGDSNMTTNDIILVSPKLNTLNLGTYRLKFFALNGIYDGNDSQLEIGTLNNNTTNAIFTPIQIVNTTKIATEYIANFDVYTGSDTYIGIRINSANNYSNIYLDNIVWEPIPACSEAANITVPIVTPTSATITWEENSLPESWQIVIGETTDTNPDLLTKNSSTTNTIELTNLKSNTKYQVWVRSVCSNNDFGSWSYPTFFTTDCNPTATFNENFDSTPIDELPTCWSSIVRGIDINNADFVKVQNDNPTKSAPNYVNLNNGNTNMNNDIILVSPNLSTLSTKKYRLTFYAKYYGENDLNNNLEIGTLNTITKYATFNTIESIKISGNTKQYKIDFSSYNGTDTHIGIRIINNGAFSSINIDNIVWEMIPTCPDVENPILTNVSTSQAIIDWDMNATVNNWEVKLGNATDENPDALATYSFTTNPQINITNLTPNTTYKVWIRSICGSNHGTWCNPLTFTTPCNEIAAFNENFDLVQTPNLPDCWSKIIRGNSISELAEIKTANTPNLSSPPNHVELSNGDSKPSDDVILVSPNLSTLSSGTYRLNFYSQKLNSNICKLEIGTLSNNTNTAIFFPVEEVNITNDLEQYIISFININSNDTFIGIRLKTENSFSTVYIDNIVWEIAPLCPDVSSINVPSETTNSAIIKWTPGADETNWDVAFGPVSITNPDNETFTSVNLPSIEITNLTENTSYNVWVRSVCGDKKGAWIGPTTFFTDCNAVDSIDENFDNVTVPNIPDCWRKIVRGTNISKNATIDTQVWGGVVSQPNCLSFYRADSLNPYEMILVSPSLTTLKNPAYQLSFTLNGTGSIEIGTLNSNDGYALFTPLKSYNANSSIQQITTDFKSYTGTDTYIGIRANPSFLSVTNIDNFVWKNTLTTNTFNKSNLSYYPNPVKNVLNISNSNNITAVNIYNILGQEVIAKPINHNLTKIDLSSIAKGTYMVKVTSDNLVQTIKVFKE